MNNESASAGRRVLSWVSPIIIGLTLISSTTVTCMGLVFNYVNTKVLAIDIGCLAVLAIGLVLISWSQFKAAVTSSRIVQAVLIFVLISGIATIIGKDPTLSFYGHFERGTGLFFTLLTVFGSLAALIVAHRHNRVRSAVLYPLAIAGGILGLLTWFGDTGFNTSWWSVLGSTSVGGATMGNSSYAGTVLLMAFFVAAYLALTETRMWKKVLVIIFAFFTAVNPVLITLPFFKPLSGTALGFIGDARGAAMSLIAGVVMGIAVLLAYSPKKKFHVAGLIGAGAVVVGIVFGIVMLVIPGTLVHNYFIKESGEARFIYWNMAVDQIKSHPVLGTGPETFRYAHERFFNQKLIVIGELWADKPHSVYLETALGTGIIGFLAYMAILGFLIKKLISMRDRKHRFLVAAALGLITAYALNNVIIFDTMTSWFMFVVIAFWIAGETEWSGLSHAALETVKTPVFERIAKGALVVVVVIPAAFVIYGMTVKLNYAWKELFAQAPYRTTLYAKTEAASPYGAGISFAQRADTYSQQYGTDTTTPPDVALADIHAIMDVLLDEMQKYPPNMQSYIALGRLAADDMRYRGTVTASDLALLRSAGDGINRVSQSGNPLGAYMLQRADYLQKKYGAN